MGRRQGVVTIRAVLHPDDDVGARPECEALEGLHARGPIRLRDAQASDNRIALIEELEHLESASLLVQIPEAVNDLPAGASGGWPLMVGRLDTLPDHGAIEELVPGAELAAPEGGIRVPNHLVASCHHPGS